MRNVRRSGRAGRLAAPSWPVLADAPSHPSKPASRETARCSSVPASGTVPMGFGFSYVSDQAGTVSTARTGGMGSAMVSPSSFRICSDVRSACATMVSDGLKPVEDGRKEASTT